MGSLVGLHVVGEPMKGISDTGEVLDPSVEIWDVGEVLVDPLLGLSAAGELVVVWLAGELVLRSAAGVSAIGDSVGVFDVGATVGAAEPVGEILIEGSSVGSCVIE